MKLRQVAIAARHLEPYRSQLFDLWGLTADFKDPGVGEFGLENSVMALGNSFFEIVAPVQEQTAAGRSLDKAAADACGYMLLFQVENFAEFDQHLDQLQIRKVWHSERDEVSACHVHPKDIGGAIVSFDEMRPPASWLWGGPNWTQQQASNCDGIVGCTISATDPSTLAQHWSTVLRVEVTETPSDLRLCLQDNTYVAFTEGSDLAALTAMTVAVPDAKIAYAQAQRIGLGDAPSLGSFSLHFVDSAN